MLNSEPKLGDISDSRRVRLVFLFLLMPLSIETEEVTDEATTVLEVFDTLVATFQLDLPYSVALFSLLSAWFFEILVSLLPNTKKLDFA